MAHWTPDWFVSPTAPGDSLADAAQGTSSKSGKCATCQESLQNCTGHFGHVRLPLPAFHIGYLPFVRTILQDICKVIETVH